MPPARSTRAVSPTLRLMISAVALTAIGLVASGDSRAVANHVSCGQTITVDTTLDGDLTDCPNNGIVIGADNITLDLNGHTVDSDGELVDPCPRRATCDVGVDNTAGHNHVTIKGGSLRQFEVGVSVLGASDNRLRGLSSSRNEFGIVLGRSSDSRIERNSLSNNATSGLVLFNAHANRIARNSADRNSGASFFLSGSDHNQIQRNELDRNAHGIEIHGGARNQVRNNSVSHTVAIAIDLSDSTIDNRIVKNRITDTGYQGIASFFSSDNRISRNTLARTGFFGGSDNGGFGIELGGADGDTVARNSIMGSRRQGILVRSFGSHLRSKRNLIARNTVNGGFNDGIRVDRASRATRIVRNEANRNRNDGIDVNSSRAALARNTANRNHDLGIEAVRGVTDRGGNQAIANGDPRQCRDVACR